MLSAEKVLQVDNPCPYAAADAEQVEGPPAIVLVLQLQLVMAAAWLRPLL